MEFLRILELIFLIIIGIQVLYFFVFSVASLFPHRPKTANPASFRKNKIAVFIPGYKEDNIIVDTAENALRQSYSKENYEVVVLADSFQKATLEKLKRLDIQLIEVSFENSTKAKSLNQGLEILSQKSPDIAVILDSDNVMEADFLEKINAAFNAGYRVVQGHRTAKNQDTAFALLDAINEEIGNSIFRKGHRNLGVSSALIGSAMAFDFQYFKKIMSDIQDVAGEDKLIELKVLQDRQTIEYLGDAFVYDEKVSTSKNFSKQRTRWVGAQFYFLKNYIGAALRQLFAKGNFGYFDKVFQWALIPKVLLIGLMGMLGILGIIGWLSPAWIGLAAAYFLALLLAVPRRFYNGKLIRAVLHIPKAIFAMMAGILKINKKTATEFEVTEKGNS